MTRDSELANGLRTRAGFLAKADEQDWRDEIGASVSLLNEAADTIDRLTSTGEAVEREAIRQASLAGVVYDELDETGSDGENKRHYRSLARRALSASPREGHVEVSVKARAEHLFKEVSDALGGPGSLNAQVYSVIYRAMIALILTKPETKS